MKTIRALFGATLVVASFGLALAKLPACANVTVSPPSTPTSVPPLRVAAVVLS